MRLIDADALKEIYTCNFDYENCIYDGATVVGNVDEAPTVDAVPVEWIEETMKLAESVGAKEYAEHLEVLLADWLEREERMKANEYIPADIDHNIKVALEKLKEAYWSNDYKNMAHQFKEAEGIIISALVFGDYDIVRKEE